jgi:hypothetical protein
MDNEKLAGILTDPKLLVRAVRKRWPGTFEQKLAWDAVDRPHYAYCVMQAALQARALGIPEISAIELGVAGGNGLVTLEQIAIEAEAATGVRVATIGFDAGSGMPVPIDYRDLPYVWQPGFFEMDEAALRRRLSRSELFIGNVNETVPAFVARDDFAPIGFVSFDLDYYSSTVASMKLLETAPERRLPRLFCYFDDVLGDDIEIHSRYVGELLAIDEFNAAHSDAKVAPIHGLAHKRRIPAAWNDQVYVCHAFTHPQYDTHIHPSDWDLRLQR